MSSWPARCASVIRARTCCGLLSVGMVGGRVVGVGGGVGVGGVGVGGVGRGTVGAGVVVPPGDEPDCGAAGPPGVGCPDVHADSTSSAPAATSARRCTGSS